MPQRSSAREVIEHRTGWTETDSSEFRDELWKLRRFGATALIGCTFGAGAAGLLGTTEDIGGITVKSKPSVGTGAMLRVATEAVRYRTGIPGEPGIIVEPIDSVNTPEVAKVEDVEDVIAKLGDPEVIARQIVLGTYRNVLIGGGIGASLALMLNGIMAGPARLDRRQRLIMGSTIGALSQVLPAVALQPSIEASQRDWTTVASVFDGTRFDNIDVSGAFATSAIETMQENETYFNEIEAKMKNRLKPVLAEDKARGYETMLLDTDWHCRFGMARVTGAVVEGLDVQTLFIAGDMVVSDLDQERLCINVYDQRVLSKVPGAKFAVAGNHDGERTIKQLESKGVNVLQDEVVKVDGISIYGDSDPRRTATAQPRRLRNPDEFISEFEDRMIATTGRLKPDIFLIHDAENIPEARVNSGLTLSGHYHTLHVDESGNWMQGGTSGGAVENQPTYVGKLGAPASLQVLYKDPDSNKIVGYRSITVFPSQQISIGNYTPLKKPVDPRIPRQLTR